MNEAEAPQIKEPTITPDDITALMPGRPYDVDVVTFRGYLSAEADDFYRLFTSKRLDEWLEIPKHALLFQLPGNVQMDAMSTVWVQRDERLVECHRARACHLAAEADAEFGMDPTNTNPAGEYPKYHRP
jgi:hypothetical protein